MTTLSWPVEPCTPTFGHDEWEEFAPSLKTLEQPTEIRRRVLTAFERAERASDPDERRKCLAFVVVGGGPTGVKLAGAIGEMSRYTLAKDFRSHELHSRPLRGSLDRSCVLF